ncbi:anti-repressor SinI family protein [Metabacillus sediminilitoris]|uniref:anti-repressor SinI family protein n=1 Tax=Metabacillus sediminilitoris TaxID=2567941 RepID=UPI0012D70C30|nr:anti-repressor SinI family protein [Metabacillus sediminilitoris]QGQ44774.1 DNA-binding anti-repressor SinI [Metabacillus sediminilitoris]
MREEWIELLLEAKALGLTVEEVREFLGLTDDSLTDEKDVLQVNHRHVIFTIDEGLLEVFLLHRHLLKDLMDASSKLITDFFQKKAKVTPGIISGLHTFGSR